MKRKADYAFWTFVTLSAFAGLTTVFNVTRTYSATTGNSEIYKQLDLFGDVLERVRNDYVEKPDDTKLIESAINGMLSSLDPHSAYLNSKHFSDMQVQTKGEFGGLGIEVTMEDKVVKVVAPIDDTPAARAGVMANDLITHLDNEFDRRAHARTGGRKDARQGRHTHHLDGTAEGTRRTARDQAHARRDQDQRGTLPRRR